MNRRKWMQQLLSFLAAFSIAPLLPKAEYIAFKKVERMNPDGTLSTLTDGFRSIKRGDKVRWSNDWESLKDAPFVVATCDAQRDRDATGKRCYAIEWDSTEEINRWHENNALKYWTKSSA